MPERRFLLVDADVLPEVFGKVLQAKELLASGAVPNISAAARQAGISRSAFYKYKDTVFDAETGRETITVVATQDTVESDSFDKDYDADAEYPVVGCGRCEYRRRHRAEGQGRGSHHSGNGACGRSG